MREYVVNVAEASSWPDFIAAFNRDFISPMGNAEWNGNLDAFNDFLWWPEEHPYRLVVRGWSASAPIINQHNTWDGRPVLEVINEIFRSNPQVDVVLD